MRPQWTPPRPEDPRPRRSWYRRNRGWFFPLMCGVSFWGSYTIGTWLFH